MFQDKKLSTRLTGGFGIILILLAISLIYGYFKVAEINSVALNMADAFREASMDVEDIGQDEIKEMEQIVFSGTRLDIGYYIDEILDEDQQEEIHEYFLEADSDNIDVAVKEFGGEYEDEDAYQLDKINICPTTDQIIDINIWLKSPELKDSLVQIFNNWQLGDGYYILPFSENRSPTLEEAAGMSLQEFYSTYRNPNTQVCIQAQGMLADRFP